MKRTLISLLVVFSLLLAGVYAGVSFYFSDLVVAFDTRSLEEDRQRKQIAGPAQFGRPVLIFVPGALGLSGLRAAFNPATVAPAEAARHIEAPVFLLHSLQDMYTVAGHSQAIYENVSHDRKVLHLIDWGTPHGRAISSHFDDYKVLVDDFLYTYVPEFGPGGGR
jgi:hypothetical protein